MNKPVAVTLFSGLGSSSKALRDLGYDVIPHDFMPEAVATLRANGFRQAREIDVRKIDFTVPAYRNVEVLAGGPPCQPFSQSANNDGQYDERDMIPEFLRAIAELTPALFVMEEVQTLTWKRHAAYLEMVEDHMRALGYVVEHRILNAADFGHAQARKRLFVVGVRADVAESETRQRVLGGPVAWLDKADYTPRTMSEALGWGYGTAYERNLLAPEPARVDGSHGALLGKPGQPTRPNTPALDARLDWVYNRASTTVVGTFRPEVQAAPGYRKAGDGPRQNTPGSVVTTLEERLILQDMPTDWIVCGSEAKRALQVGNSVPCGLIRDLIDINIP